MNQPTLHTGLAHLLEASGVKSQYPDLVCFSAYNAGEHDVLGAGISRLVKFRLLHPETPVLFLSFLPKEKLLTQDEFGVLQLPGTEFIQLPFDKATIFQLAAKHSVNLLTVSSKEWRSFSERACKSLIQKRMLELTHGNKFPIGNKALNPPRFDCSGLLSFPNLKEDYLPLIQKDFESLKQFIAIPEIAELLQWCGVCNHSEDVYLQNAFAFATQVKQLSAFSSHTDAAEIISLIDRVNDSFKQLQPN